ncbi:MAG: histidine kinase N-terminal 7TM domain-containing protein [Candidatus Hodarchaeales archaeon]
MMSSELLGEYFFNPWALPYYFAALASLVIGLVLIYKAERTPSVMVFTGAQISNLGSSFSAALATSVREGHPGLWNNWMQVNGFFAILTVVLFFHFSYIYLKDNFLLSNRLILIPYLIPIGFSILRANLYYKDIRLTERSVYGLYDVGSSEIITLFYMIAYLILAIFLILTAYNFFRMSRSDDKELQQISGYFILASVIPLFALTIFLLINFISPDLYIEIELTNLSTVFVNLILGYGILKKDLFNINELLRKRIIPYALTNFFLTWGLILTKETINHFFAEVFFGGIEELSMGLMILLFVPIHDLSHYLTSKLIPFEANH